MAQYKQADVEIISFTRTIPGETEIRYRPILESMYYCPGIRVRPEHGRQRVSFVRCGIREKCAVDVTSTKVEPGAWKVVVPSAPESIELVFSDGAFALSR